MLVTVSGFIVCVSSKRKIEGIELPTNTVLPEFKINELEEALKNGIFYILDQRIICTT